MSHLVTGLKSVALWGKHLWGELEASGVDANQPVHTARSCVGSLRGNTKAVRRAEVALPTLDPP